MFLVRTKERGEHWLLEGNQGNVIKISTKELSGIDGYGSLARENLKVSFEKSDYSNLKEKRSKKYKRKNKIRK